MNRSALPSTVRQWKAEAAALADRGDYEDALPLMQRLVEDHLAEFCPRCPCLLYDLALLYVDMLMLDEAEDAARLILRLAKDYDLRKCKGWATEIRQHVNERRSIGWQYGTAVQLNVREPELRGSIGKIGGYEGGMLTQQAGGIFRVLLGKDYVWIPRDELRSATVIVQLSLAPTSIHSWRANGSLMSGAACAQFIVLHSELTVNAMQRKCAAEMRQQYFSIRIILPDGKLLIEGAAGDTVLRQYAETVSATDDGQHPCETDVGENATVLKCKKCKSHVSLQNLTAMRCEKCQKVFYCSVVCQRADRKSHRRSCRRICRAAQRQLGVLGSIHSDAARRAAST